MSAIGNRIKLIRGKLTQSEFAKIAGVRKNYISNYETRDINPTADVLCNFAKNLNINIHWLLTGEGSMYYSKDDTSKDAMIQNLQTELNERNKQLQRVRDAAQITKSETNTIRAAEIIVASEVFEKSKLKKK